MMEIPAAHPAPLPALTHGRVLRIALPIVISNATIPLLGAVPQGWGSTSR